MSSDQNSLLPQNCGDIIRSGSQSQKLMMSTRELVESPSGDDLNGGHELTMTHHDDYESSFWFTRNELNYLRTPTHVMDLLDESLDFVWHGL